MKEYEMTEPELAELQEACRPVPYLIIGGMEPPSPQDNANAAWKNLARKYGFVWDTVKPIPGSYRRFTAQREPKE